MSPANLMKTVMRSEYRGRSSGLSIKVAPGVRVRAGGSRGRRVELGETLQPSDTGVLCVTSERSVFLGAKTTLDLPHTKLLNLTAESGYLQLHGSGRRQPSVFVVANPEVVVATVRAVRNPSATVAPPARAPVAGAATASTSEPGQPAPVSLPSRFTQRWIEDNFPRMDANRTRFVIAALRERNWTDADLSERVYPFLSDAVRREFGLL